ncbi:MAG: DUF4258 domain-containing protein [Chloroflexi bacterium]|nr:DUF4258 domain-containing protein [Chloroflexota bacterium]
MILARGLSYDGRTSDDGLAFTLDIRRDASINKQPEFSAHALQRCAERNVSEDEILYIIANGHTFHNAGAVFAELRKDSVPEEDHRDQRIAQLIGTTVVLNTTCSTVITVYRNRCAGKKNRRKAKYRQAA